MYGSILAEIHDRWFSAIAESAAAHLRAAVKPLAPYRLLDLGCGSGIVAAALSSDCRSIHGIDLSPEMIAKCRERVPHGTFHAGDILTVDLPETDVTVMAGEILSYAMSGEDRTPDDLERFLRTVYDRTRPGGLFLFDVLGPHEYAGKFIHEHPEYTIFSHVSMDNDIVTRTITSFLRRGTLFEKSVEIHRMRVFDSEELTELLARIGWNVRPMTHYAGMEVFSGRLAFECRRSE